MVNMMMEWQKEVQRWQQLHNKGNVDAAMYVKVMTDEQLETLRKQIAVYSTICEQLVEMHRTLSTHHDLAGLLLPFPFFFLSENVYYELIMNSQ